MAVVSGEPRGAFLAGGPFHLREQPTSEAGIAMLRRDLKLDQVDTSRRLDIDGAAGPCAPARTERAEHTHRVDGASSDDAERRDVAAARQLCKPDSGPVEFDDEHLGRPVDETSRQKPGPKLLCLPNRAGHRDRLSRRREELKLREGGDIIDDAAVELDSRFLGHCRSLASSTATSNRTSDTLGREGSPRSGELGHHAA